MERTPSAPPATRCTSSFILGRAQYYRYRTVEWQVAQRKTSTGPFGKLGLASNPYLFVVCPFFVECPLIYTWHPVARRYTSNSEPHVSMPTNLWSNASPDGSANQLSHEYPPPLDDASVKQYLTCPPLNWGERR